VAKNRYPKELNDLRPLALERLVKKILSVKVHGMLDPMQFAYQVNRGVDDATTTIFCISILRGKKHARLVLVEHLTQSKHTF